MTKRRLLVVLLIAVIVLSLVAFVGCKDTKSVQYEIKVESSNVEISKGESKLLEYSVLADGQEVQSEVVVSVIEGEDVVSYTEAEGIKALKSGTAKVSIALKDNADVNAIININVPTYTIAFSIEEIEKYVGETFTMPTVVKKDGAVVNGQKVNLSVEGDAITVSAKTKNVTAVKVGEAYLVATLANDSDVVARAKIIVKEAFFSRDVVRGSFDFKNEEQGSVEVLSGQATLVASKSSTKFVFRTYIDIKSVVANNESIGVGSFLDNGDNALWFGLHGADTAGEYYVYIRNFYKGWNPPFHEVYNVGNYQSLSFDGKIEFVIVRDGCDYWYSIGGYTGTYSDASLMDGESWPGIYSQDKMLTVSDYSVSYEQKDIDAAKEECEVKVARLDINPSSVKIVEKGSQQQFSAIIYSSQNVEEEIVWSVDKSEMTAGSEETSISNGLLVLSNEAAGYVTVKASIGGKEQSVRIEISAEELGKQSENIKVNGGVGLDVESEVITFPEDRNFNNANLNLDRAVETLYIAELLKSVKGDYTVEFKVSDYKVAEGKDGGLLLALGGANNNIVFRGAAVEAHVWNYNADSKYSASTISGTGSLAEGNEHTYKVVVANGVYSIYIDNAIVELNGTAVCNPEEYKADRKISFTVLEGTSLSISNVVLTQGEDNGNLYYVINNNVELTENGFILNVLSNQWIGKDDNSTRLCYLPEIPENFIITLDVKYSQAMADAKFAISIDDKYLRSENYEFHVNNKETLEGEIYPRGWNGPKASTTLAANETNTITIQCIDGVATFYIGSVKIGSCNGVAGGKLSFWTFGSSSDSGSVIVENLTINTQFAIIEGSDAAQAGTTTEKYIAKEYGDAEAKVELDTTDVTAGSVVLNDDLSVTLSSDAQGSFIVKATVGSYVSQIKVLISSQPADQDTELAISKGGVIQDVANGVLTFDNADKNGVSDEENQSHSEYYAELKTKIRGDFSIEFTVSDYVTTAKYPKVMISLGGSHNQFYVVQFTDGRSRIESFSNTASNYYGGWNSTPEFDNYNQTDSHSFKVTCIDGVYAWYLKVNDEWQDLHFYDGGYSTNPEQTLIRTNGDINREHSIIISTNSGTTATVSDIKVSTDDSKLGNDKFVTNNDNNSNVSENGFTLSFQHQAWLGSNKGEKLTYYTEEISGDCDITFNAAFDATGDVKLCVVFGYNKDQEFTICNNGDMVKGEVREWWGGTSHYDWDHTNVRITIQIRGNKAKMLINDTAIGGGDTIDINPDAVLGFYAFDEGATGTVTVSNFAITSVAAE